MFGKKLRSHSDYLHLPNLTTTNQILSGHIFRIYINSNVTKNGKIEGCGLFGGDEI